MSTLDTLQNKITHAMLSGAKSDIRMGGYLAEAKTKFEQAKEFYTWSDDMCNVKRAQACELIKIHSHFADIQHEGMLKLAMRVKMNVIRHSLFEEAEKALDDGHKVDTAWIKAHVDPVEPKPKAEKAESSSESEASDTSDTGETEPTDEVADLKARLKEALIALAEAQSGKRTVYMLPHFNSKNAYMVLGIDQSATKAMIRKAWKAMMLIHHPDKCANVDLATDITKKINAAYESLVA